MWIVGAQQVQFAQIADYVPIRGRKTESLIGRFRRWIKHDTITLDDYWLPFARAEVASLASAPLTLRLDGTVAGRGCVVLMASVVYHGHAIPLRWIVVKGKKGHLPEVVHCTLIDHVRPFILAGATVLVLGDGEFDGTELQATISDAGWQYAVALPPTS